MSRLSTSLDRRAQLQNLAPVMIALVLAAVLLVFGLIMTQGVRDTDVVTKVLTVTVTNETVTQAELIAGTALEGAASAGANSFVVTAVFNDSLSPALTTGNYSVNAATGVLSNLTSEYSTVSWNVSYTYWHGDEAYIAGNETIVGLGTFADFWEIIVLAIVITIVIGLLLIVFGGRQQR